MKNRRSDAENYTLIKEDKRIAMNKIIWQNYGNAQSQKNICIFFQYVQK